MFPFQVQDLGHGFKYLGYYLKPNNYRNEDWWWLLRKMEKRIGQWCNKWLTLGGILFLLKSVLENILVFWLSMAKIPTYIFNRIGTKFFSLLWYGQKDKERFHLVRWERLACPKDHGGWGLKSILYFGKALVVKSLWRGLFSSRMMSLDPNI